MNAFARPQTITVNLRTFPLALAPLAAERRWVTWRWLPDRNGRATKVPYQPGSPDRKARSNDASTWGHHATAVEDAEAGRVDGIGFMLAGSKLGVFDIDDARDPRSGVIEGWAWDIIERCDTYTEVTIRGGGVRVIGEGIGPYVHRKQKVPGSSGSVESYRTCERFIVMTFAPLPNFNGHLRNIDAMIDETVAWLDETAKAPKQPDPTQTDTSRYFNQPGMPLRGGDTSSELDDLIRYGVPPGQRSEKFFHVVGWLKDRGHTTTEIEVLLAAYPGGIAAKFVGRLRSEIERAFGKAETKTGTGSTSGSAQSWTDAKAPPRITAKPFVYRDPKTFPRRQWLYGHHLIRKFLSATVAPGSVGKTSLILVEAVAMASGRNLLGVPVRGGPHVVWVINLEDPREEIERRVVAILMHFKIDPSEIEGRLFLNSGRDTDVVVATATKNGTTIAQPVVDALKAEIIAKKADVVVIDPLVKAHRVPENDNGAIDLVCTIFAGIADETNCAFDLVHHVRKTNGAEVTIEDSRGAVALASAARSMRALNRMSKDEGERAEVEDHKAYFRAETGKANLAPPEKADWFKLTSVSLENGSDNPLDFNMGSDHVAVAGPWQWPDALDDVKTADLLAIQRVVDGGRWRANAQAADWVGKAVAQVLKLDLASKAHRSKIASLLKVWIGTGALACVDGTDAKREKRTFVEVGTWATD